MNIKKLKTKFVPGLVLLVAVMTPVFGNMLSELFKWSVDAKASWSWDRATFLSMVFFGFYTLFVSVLYRSRHKILPVTNLNKCEKIRPASALIMFLSPHNISPRGDNWEQMKHGIKPHRDNLESLWLLVSEGAKGSCQDFASIPNYLNEILTEKTAIKNTLAIDFESLEQLVETLGEVVNNLVEAGVAENNICIDFTGGMKPTAVAAALSTLNTRVRLQYVSNAHVVNNYDPRLTWNDR